MIRAILICACLFFVLNLSASAQDNSWVPPKPVENALLEKMVGQWTGENEMAGVKMQDEANIYWMLNHQFLMVEVKSTTPQFSFNGRLMLSVDSKGNPVAWWFDDWGPEGAMTGTGTFNGEKMTIVSSNSTMSDNRTYSVNDGKLVMEWNSSAKLPDGQDYKMSGTTTYTKK